MKASISSLSALVLLLIYTVRAEGQIDSVWLSIHVKGLSYDWSCTAGGYCDTTVQCSGHIDRTLETSKACAWRNDTLIMSPFMIPAWLVRDTLSHRITHLEVGFFGGAPECALPGQVEQYINYCSDVFSNIPYTSDSMSNISIACNNYYGSSQATCEVDVSAGCGDILSGSANWSGPINDSICITISPMPKASVENDIGSHAPLFTLTPEGLELNAGASGKLVLFDALGRIVRSQYVNSSLEPSAISFQGLVSGCYFARLGDQVAKFVVPPR